MENRLNPLNPEVGFYLEDWFVEPEMCRVSRLAETHRVEPKVMDVLVLLALNRNRVLRKDEIISRIWGEVNVVENVLARAVSEIRKTFGDSARRQGVVQTIPKVGYRLVANVSPLVKEEIFADSPVVPPKATQSAVHKRSFWIGAAVAVVLLVSVLLMLAFAFMGKIVHHEEVEIKTRNPAAGRMGMHR